MWPLRKREPDAEFRERANDAFAKKEVLGTAVVALLHCVKELSLDLTEVGSDELKEQVEALSRRIKTDQLSARLGSDVENAREDILAYADRARGYVAERESELKRIVELLRSGLDVLAQDNEQFNQRVQERAGRLEQISQLGDIKQLRQQLHQEVHQLREAAVSKRREDAARVHSLHREVEQLRGDVDQARNEALRDALTGAGNRLAFDQRLELLIDRNGIQPTPFSLMLIDVDHFKNVNDSYGHPVGDRVLMALVQTCRENVRRDDFVGRYGGEEFAILMPGAPASVALKKAKHLCKVQSKLSYAVDETRQISFSVTCGVTEYRAGDTPETMVARADKALYAGKRAGRNRAVLEK